MNKELQQKIEELADEYSLVPYDRTIFNDALKSILSSPDLLRLAGYIPLTELIQLVEWNSDEDGRIWDGLKFVDRKQFLNTHYPLTDKPQP